MAQILQDQYILGHSDTKSITTIGQEIAMDLTLQPQPAVTFGSVTGTVTDGTVPLSGAYVKIMDSNYNPVAHTVTNASGQFTFTTLPPNTTYYAYASSPGYKLARSSQFTVTTATPTNIGTIALSTNPNATMSIIAGDLKSTTGVPINGAVCYLYSTDPVSQTPVLLEITYTNAYGQFAFRDLDATGGTTQYTINFTALGYENSSLTTSISGANKIVFIPDATMQPDTNTSSGTVSGMIKDSNGIIVDADVILYSVDTTTNTLTPIAKTKTDSHGVYLFFNVAPGSYMVKSNKMVIKDISV